MLYNSNPGAYSLIFLCTHNVVEYAMVYCIPQWPQEDWLLMHESSKEP